MDSLASPAVAMWVASALAPYLNSHSSTSHSETVITDPYPSTNSTSAHSSHPSHHSVFSNQNMFEAGIGLLILQSLWTLLAARFRTWWDQYWEGNSHTIMLAEGLEGDEAFEAVAEWALKVLEDQETERLAKLSKNPTKKPSLLSRLSFMTAETDPQIKSVIARATYNGTYDSDTENYDNYYGYSRPSKPRLSFTPDNGTYTITHNSHTIKIGFGIKGTEGGDTGVAAKARTLTLSCTTAPKSTETPMQVLKGIVQMSLEKASENQGPKTHIFIDHYEGWKRTCSRRPRSISSVILKKGVKENLMTDIKRFLSSQKWYQTCGVPYRRGYLLYGPPGTGKTSLIVSLAGEFNLNVCIVNLAGMGMSDSRLLQLLSDSPPQTILLLEDIDVAMKSGKQTNPSHTSSSSSDSNSENNNDSTNNNETFDPSSTLTLSGLLNALDGVASQEGRITFMTTNNVPSLPPALLRPGRCDVKLLLDLCSRDQIAGLFAKFFGTSPPSFKDSPVDDGEEEEGETYATLSYEEALKKGYEVAEQIPEGKLSPAQ
ncbi:mitochondrial chaperone, partial [Rhizophlyctis rosea]